ncbi:hypothetical protein [Leptospira sp. 'Mane']|uniref:hypothetical protein n=1 Tax=Leptospira sp. 'Mane' TaxID=3387407 RepID=UPI00398A854D
MKSLRALICLICLVPYITLPMALMSQTKEGFQDTNNYDLRNLPGSDPEGNVLRDVEQPLSFEKPVLATPKDVRTKYDPILSIPGAGALMQNQPLNQNANNQNALQRAGSSPINPLTGEVNPAALQNQGERSRIKKEAQKKLREEFDDEAVYEETKFRRGYIIFFLTLPFALAASAGVTSFLAVGLQKSIVGSMIMITGTVGLSGTNVYLDRQRLDENREKKKQTEKTTPPATTPPNP